MLKHEPLQWFMLRYSIVYLLLLSLLYLLHTLYNCDLSTYIFLLIFPILSMSRRLNYPPVQFVCSANIAKNYLLSQVQALDSPMPDVLHLFNLRTLTSAAVASEKTKPNIAAEKLRPSTSALLILHRQVKPEAISSIMAKHEFAKNIYLQT